VFYWVAKYTLGIALWLVFRPWSRGRRNLPRRGPVILASNHLSFADHFFGPLPLPRKVVFLAKAEYFTRPGFMGLVSRAFFSGAGQIPVDRTGGEASEQALQAGLRVLAEGNVLGIYPEGTRSRDGKLHKGKTGVARLALESRAPVVPCAMIGTFEFLPSGSFRPSLRIRPGVMGCSSCFSPVSELCMRIIKQTALAVHAPCLAASLSAAARAPGHARGP